ncbi:MAG TPA: hypothetical protein VKY85_07320 [Candidatus Angelobacter sp.]|nr:hypothetical protein [Candidatus Angelobacter sp.]
MNLDDQQRMETIDLAVEGEALKQCEYHGELYDSGTVDLQPAYTFANRKFTRGEVSSFRDRRGMTEAIKTLHREAAMDCWQCEKQREEYP